MMRRCWPARPLQMRDSELSIRRQMEAALQIPLDGDLEAKRGHTYRWTEIHPKHRLGRRFKLAAILDRAKQRLG